MVCLYCHSKTKIINSRFNKELFKTWRRHKCIKCGAMFTSYENIELGQAIKVSNNTGDLAFFDNNKLFTSIYSCLFHQNNPLQAAKIVNNAVLRHILTAKSLPIISTEQIIYFTALALKQYDASAAIKYLSDKSHLQLSKEVKAALNKLKPIS